MKMFRPSSLFAWAIVLGGLTFAHAHAQDCDTYYPTKNGSVTEQTHYNAKGKVESVVTTTIQDKSHEGGMLVVNSNSKVTDPKGKEISSVDFDVECGDGELKIDIKAMGMNNNQMAGVEGIEMRMEGEDIVWPKNLSVGSTMPDAHVKMTAVMNGMTISTTEMTITNRKVVAMEKRTTPAGTFDCIVVEEDSHVKTMGMNMDSHSKGWYAKGVGMVRQESSRNGKMESYSELTKVSGI